MSSGAAKLPSEYETDLHQIVRNSRALSDGTKKVYLTRLDHFFSYISAVFGPKEINNPVHWNQKTVEAFHSYMLGKGVTAGTANGAVYALRYAAKWYATREGLPHLRDFPKIELPWLDEEAREPLSFDEARRLLETTRGKHPRDLRDRALIVTALETGMRRMSLSGMCWDKFDESAGYTVCTVPVKRKKRSDKFAVPFSETALRSLEPWKKWCKRHSFDVKAGPVFKSVDTNRLPPRVGETALSVDAIYDVIVNRAKKAELKHKHPHELRHTFVSWRMNAGVPPHSIMAVSGHEVGEKLPAMIKLYSGVILAEQALAATPSWLKDLVIDLEQDV